MATVELNKQMWDGNYEWIKQGEEWSRAWGGSEAQWSAAIMPRIHTFVPTGTILEIAPGYGRWTNYLKDYCDNLIAIDLSESCIQSCQQRFSNSLHITYHVNDGISLEMVEDHSVDFVFSYDSLVHAEADVIEAYIRQLSRKLKRHGVGFIHHSNIGRYQQIFSEIEKIQGTMRESIVNRIFLSPKHWRASSMTAERFSGFCDQFGLTCIGQELVNWGTDGLLNDCFSLFTPKDSKWSRANRIIENTDFMNEARLIRKLSSLYSVSSIPDENKTDPR